MPPIGPPVCDPGCGANAHCEYGQSNTCQCNAGYVGNPYTGCKSSQNLDSSCSTLKCGPNAICSMVSGTPECICTKGYSGKDCKKKYSLKKLL